MRPLLLMLASWGLEGVAIWLGSRLNFHPLLASQSVRIIGATSLYAVLSYAGWVDCKYLAWGRVDSPATPQPWLGIQDGESWKSVGLSFSISVTTITALAIYLPHRRTTSPSLLFRQPAAVASVLCLAAVNAWVEELIYRLLPLVEELIYRLLPLSLTNSGWSVSELIYTSAVSFGLPHYFGFPSKIPGALLASFLGWLLARSVVETGGLFWALLIHFLQDAVIIGILYTSNSQVSFSSQRFQSNTQLMRVASGQLLVAATSAVCGIAAMRLRSQNPRG